MPAEPAVSYAGKGLFDLLMMRISIKPDKPN
jgi:hypothetical protein